MYRSRLKFTLDQGRKPKGTRLEILLEGLENYYNWKGERSSLQAVPGKKIDCKNMHGLGMITAYGGKGKTMSPSQKGRIEPECQINQRSNGGRSQQPSGCPSNGAIVSSKDRHKDQWGIGTFGDFGIAIEGRCASKNGKWSNGR